MKRQYVVASLIGLLSIALVSCASDGEHAQVTSPSPNSPYFGVYGPGDMMDEMVRDLTPNPMAHPSMGVAIGRM